MNDLLKHLHLLYLLAREKDKNFREEDYKWVLGAKVVSDISIGDEMLVTTHRTRPLLLHGIAVERDFVNDTNIQLWKNITNDL